MINVYASDTSVFTNNGLATLEPISCELSMTINGAWVLTLVHPFDAEGRYQFLDNNEYSKGNIIKVTGITALRDCDSTQLFRIYDSVKSLTDITVTAFPIGMEATYDAIIEELKLENKTGKQVGTELATTIPNKYTLTVSSSLTKKRSVSYKNTNLIAVLCGSNDGSFVNKFNAEVAYNNYEIKVKKRLGSSTDYDVRIGKNLTGINYDIDDSSAVTRLYPISADGLRLYDATDMRYLPPAQPTRYIDSTNHVEDYPFVRAAFVDAPYSLIDTDTNATVKTKTINHTITAYNTIYDTVHDLMADVWDDIVAYNKFDYNVGPYTFSIEAVPEFLQDIIKDITLTIAEKVLGTNDQIDDIYITQPSLRNWLTKAIKAGLEWIKDEDLPPSEWYQNQDGSYSYGTSMRLLTSEWGYIDKKMSYFGSDTKWQKEKDDSFDWGWVQKKGQAKKYGNNKRYLARSTYVYDYDGGCKYYWFDEEGWWDGTSELSGWAWHQDSTGWWFGDADPDGDDSKYIHDDWAFIRETSSSPRKLYYFKSDGYLDDSKTEEVDWDWHKVNGKWYFGDTDHEDRATYLTDQWMKIEGDWYHFDGDGYVFDLEQAKLGIATSLANYIVKEAENTFLAVQDDLYDVLNDNMEEYCSDLYANGLDLPAISVTVDFVDLSKTAEYANYSNLERVCLGDDVIVHDEVHGIDSIEERVMGLTYDCLKGCNTQISVGGATSVTSLFDTSVKGTGNEQRLVAGKNVTISNGVINVESETGDIYAGDQVSVQQLTSSGTAIARIYVNGTPTTIYAVGSDVEVEPIKTEGDKIATITVGGVDYDIYADTGLKHWVETETDIYRTGTREGLTADAGYYVNSQVIWSSPRYHYKKNDTTPAVAGNFNNGTEVVLVSIDGDAVKWEYEYYWGEEVGWIHYGSSVWDRLPGYGAPRNYLAEGSWQAVRYFEFDYKGAHWYGSYMMMGEAQGFSFPFNSFVHTGIGDYTSLSRIIDAAETLIDVSHASTTIVDIVGISNQDHILYYNDDKEHNYDTQNRDDAVYISKEGVFNGTEFRVNGAAIGSFYKTNLYLGTSYSATVGLSDSYTDYDLLLIETYNQDDKKNLASMVNVSDLSNASYVGVDGYLMYTITNGRTLTFHEAPSDTNHSRYIKAVYGLRTSHDSGTVSPIEDVVVDGESCVAGGVAVINGKQDKFGDVNVSNPTDGQVLKYDANNDEWINANGSGGASAINDLTDVDITSPANGQVLKYNSTSQKWENGNGGGGTTVIANPSGTATDILTKIQVDNTIYDIQDGGGSGSRTLLFSGSASSGNITLSESYENYDYLYVVAYAVGEITALVDTDRLGYDISAFTLSECSGGSSASQSNADMYVEIVVVDSTTFTIMNPIGGIVIKKIYGINGLGGGNSKQVQALAYKQLTPTQYENLSSAEKNNGVIYFVSDNSVGAEGLSIIRISEADYENLSTAEKNNGVPYFVY